MLNYFTLFAIEQTYFIDKNDLERKYFQLQTQFHPDKCLHTDEKSKIEIIKKSADINYGYKILSNDVARASHLLELENIFVNREKNNSYKPSYALLIEQMELRERASDIESGNENKSELLSHIDAEFIGTQKEFNENYLNRNFEISAQSAIKMRYLEKLKEELEK